MENVEQTIISQYSESATIVQIIKDMDAWIDPSADIQAFYDYVFNVETAHGFGLDYWGKIVGVNRELKIVSTEKNFGFSEGEFATFGEGAFRQDAETSTTYILPDTGYRKLILAKALANISSVTAPATNQMLTNLFSDRGKSYVVDLGGMSIRYVFNFTPTDIESAIIKNSGALPRPAGVTVFTTFA
jgi:hypothetical protein